MSTWSDRLWGQACPSLQWRGIICLAYCCGLRSGEILNLTWSDIDFASEELRVLDKPDRGGMHKWTPKDKDPRVIPVPTEAVGLLTALYAIARDRQTYVFVNSKGPAAGDRVKRQNTWRDFHAIARRAGLPTCSLHHLRKTWCTNLAGSLPMHVVQELAGHSDIRTTRQFYVKIPPEQMARARRAIDSLVGPDLATE